MAASNARPSAAESIAERELVDARRQLVFKAIR